MQPEDVVRTTYSAYNARNLDLAVANLTTDVEWDDGTGRIVHGPDAVAVHWTEQWRTADARVEIEHLEWIGDELSLGVRLETYGPDGGRRKQSLTNVIGFQGDPIRSMHIKAGAS